MTTTDEDLAADINDRAGIDPESPADLGQDPDFDPLAPDADAPYGYTLDRTTGERRAKKLPGRPAGSRARATSSRDFGGSPSIEDLKKQAKDGGKKDEDRAPGAARPRRGRSRAPGGADKPEPETPPFRAGPIAKGVNKLYARAGKIVKVMDSDIGAAILSMTRKESEDDVTVGEAWEEVAKTNPRIRRFLLKIIAGGAWGQLVMAHAPLFLAIIMKDSIKKHIPFMKLIEAMLSNEDDGSPSDISKMMGGITPEDASQMMDLAQNLMGQMGFQMVFPDQRAPNEPRHPVVDGEVITE